VANYSTKHVATPLLAAAAARSQNSTRQCPDSQPILRVAETIDDWIGGAVDVINPNRYVKRSLIETFLAESLSRQHYGEWQPAQQQHPSYGA
jgi:hypothetical protein